jgi:hypothetical protein
MYLGHSKFNGSAPNSVISSSFLEKVPVSALFFSFNFVFNTYSGTLNIRQLGNLNPPGALSIQARWNNKQITQQAAACLKRWKYPYYKKRTAP